MDGGAAEEGEADEEGVGAVGIGANLALQTAEVAANHADGVVDTECSRDKLNWAVGLAEHEFQLPYLCVADDCHRLVEPPAIGRAIYHKAIDIREIDDLTALLLGTPHKNRRWYHHTVDYLAAPVGPDPHLLLSGDIRFQANTGQLVCYRPLMTGVYDGDKPFALWHAYGAVNARRHCRQNCLGKRTLRVFNHTKWSQSLSQRYLSGNKVTNISWIKVYLN